MKSVNLFKNKNFFDVNSIDLNKLALSYGLMSSPQIIVKKNNNNDFEGEKKKSKLAKLKEKIKIKKEMKKKENSENE